MARREIYVDDIDGKEGDDVQARRFSIGRQAYSIDLNDKNYEEMLELFKPYMAVATLEEAPSRSVRSSAPRKASGGTSGTDKGYSASDVRAWAESEGIKVSPRGRIHKDVIEKYEYAQGKDKS